MDFKKATDVERNALVIDRDTARLHIDGLLSAMIPLDNKLMALSSEKTTELYPDQTADIDKVKAWLTKNKATLQTLLEGLYAELE